MEFIKNHIPGSMSFAEGFFVGYRSEGIPDEKFMLVDNAKACQIVGKLLAEGRDIMSAELGLDGDWRENSTQIFDGTKFHKYEAYKGSKWARPLLIVFFNDGPSESYECWKYKGKEA